MQEVNASEFNAVVSYYEAQGCVERRVCQALVGGSTLTEFYAERAGGLFGFTQAERHYTNDVAEANAVSN